MAEGNGTTIHVAAGAVQTKILLASKISAGTSHDKRSESKAHDADSGDSTHCPANASLISNRSIWREKMSSVVLKCSIFC